MTLSMHYQNYLPITSNAFLEVPLFFPSLVVSLTEVVDGYTFWEILRRIIQLRYCFAAMPQESSTNPRVTKHPGVAPRVFCPSLHLSSFQVAPPRKKKKVLREMLG